MKQSRAALPILILTVVGVTWIVVAGPVLLVRVTTTDAEGKSVPSAGGYLRVWTHHGVVDAYANESGRAAFPFVRQQADWVPSLGPGDGPPRSKFIVEVHPEKCPNRFSEVKRFVPWFWQTVHVELPPRASLELDLEDLPGEGRRVVMIRYGQSSRQLPIAREQAICIRAREPTEVSIRTDSETVLRWPEFVAEPYSTVRLSVASASM